MSALLMHAGYDSSSSANKNTYTENLLLVFLPLCFYDLMGDKLPILVGFHEII